MRQIITLLFFALLFTGCSKDTEYVELVEEEDGTNLPTFNREEAIRNDVYRVKEITFDIENGKWEEIKILVDERIFSNNTTEPIEAIFVRDKYADKYSYFQETSELSFIPQIKEGETSSTVSKAYGKEGLSKGGNYFEFKLNEKVIAPNIPYTHSIHIEDKVTIRPGETIIDTTYETFYEIEVPFTGILEGERTRFQIEINGVWFGTAPSETIHSVSSK